MLRQVLELAQRREFGRAAQMADQAVADGFEHPLLLNIIATHMEQSGRFEDALTILERATAIAPEDIGCRHARSLCLLRLERPAEALAQADLLLGKHPDFVFAHVARGEAFVALGELARAKAAYLHALEIDPQQFAATAGLAAIASHLGDHDEARRRATAALEAQPGYPDAVMSLATADLADGQYESADRRLRGPLADPRASVLDKARACGMLADVFDAQARHEEAFAAYVESGELFRRAYARLGQLPGILDYAQRLNATIARSSVADWETPSGDATGPAAGHVFLMGFPRSGTTLLEVMLDGHPGVASAEELELLVDGVERYMSDPDDLTELMAAPPEALAALREAYWARVRAAGIDVSGRVFVDKHPLNTLKLPLIARLFPQARILFAVRDPRDVVLSAFRRRFRMNRAMFQLLTLDGTAAFYDATMNTARLVEERVSRPWLVVRYESVVAAPAAELGRICEFAGIAVSSEVLDFKGRIGGRERATPSTAQLRDGLDPSRQGQWRHYAGPLQAVMPVLEPWLRRYGYEAGEAG